MSDGGTIGLSWKTVATAVGLLGTVLGSIRALRTLCLDRAILKVSVRRLINPVSHEQHLQFEVVNVGKLPISVRNVGFTLPEKRKIYRFSPAGLNGVSPFPKLIQPGDFMTCIVPPLVFADPAWKKARRPFFETADGKFVTGARINKKIIQAPLGWELA